MLIEIAKGGELLVAEIALEEPAVPGSIRWSVARIALPFEHFVGDDTVGVSAAELGEDGLAVKATSFGAGARFEMVGYAAGGHEACMAEGA